jgi:hypothetical protein
MKLTARQKSVIRTSLSYALSNIDDINEAFDVKPNEDRPPLEESEIQTLIDLFEPGHGASSNP